MRRAGAASVTSRPSMSRVVKAAPSPVTSRTTPTAASRRAISAPVGGALVAGALLADVLVADPGGLEGCHLVPDQRRRPRQMDEERGAGPLAQAHVEVEIGL